MCYGVCLRFIAVEGDWYVYREVDIERRKCVAGGKAYIVGRVCRWWYDTSWHFIFLIYAFRMYWYLNHGVIIKIVT
jgi:hypothetical protein